MKKILLTLSSVALLATSVSQAAVSVKINSTLNDSLGTELAAGSSVLLVADVDGGGIDFEEFDSAGTYASGVLGSGDIVLDWGSYVQSAGSVFGSVAGSVSFNYENPDAAFDANTFLVFYNTTDDTTPGFEVDFGIISAQFISPNNNSASDLVGGSPTVLDPNLAAFQTEAIPEPSTYALLGMGALALAALRRYRNKK